MNVVELTQALVRLPSVSGNEQGCVELLAGLLPGATVSGRNIWATRGDGPRTLLLNSHMDTVPSSDDWTIDPHGAERRGGKIHGLGANDAKGPLAALVRAFLDSDVPADGKLVLAATCDEETGGDGLDTLRPELPRLDAAIIGEPTGLTVCSCQRGMLRLRLTAKGRRAHASRPWQGENAIEKAARDITRLAALELPEHALLGPGTVQVTMISGGVRTNVVPPECVLEVDARTVPELDNAALHARIRAVVESEVELVSDRFVPVETPDDAAIVQSALGASGTERPHAFGGVSDFLHVRDVDAVVMGPGRSEQSHAADEWVEIDQLERGVAVYRDTIGRYFGWR
ncbi:MAG: M20/M25/M40 family metallo-hydrolase [Planctomycetota bacterium]|jgi:acetylornithine deacetylase